MGTVIVNKYSLIKTVNKEKEVVNPTEENFEVTSSNASTVIMVNWVNFIGIVLAIYVLISIFVFFAINSNIFPNRRFAKYELGFNSKLKYLEPDGIAYWVALNGKSDKNAVILHGFTRNSGTMESRATIYWELGYNLYLVDNAGHGLSKSILFPSGFQYSWVVKKIIDHEKIDNPVIHGASMGAIAAAYIAQKYPEIPKFIICEALPNNFDNLYNEMLEYMKFPRILFFWLDYVSRKIIWRMFMDKDAEYRLTDILCPMVIIHGENDRMFKYQDHFNKNIEQLNGREEFDSWLVGGSKHTKMNLHPEYEFKVKSFISKFE